MEMKRQASANLPSVDDAIAILQKSMQALQLTNENTSAPHGDGSVVVVGLTSSEIIRPLSSFSSMTLTIGNVKTIFGGIGANNPISSEVVHENDPTTSFDDFVPLSPSLTLFDESIMTPEDPHDPVPTVQAPLGEPFEDAAAGIVCSFCSKYYVNKYKLRLHIQRLHEEGSPPFKCDWPNCELGFVQKSELDKHVKGVHAKMKPHPCSDCNYASFLKKDMRRHAGIQHGKCLREGCGMINLQQSGHRSWIEMHNTVCHETE